MLGIGERTLYRQIQDWKLQDRIQRGRWPRPAATSAAAAKALGMSADALDRKLKKLGQRGRE